MKHYLVTLKLVIGEYEKATDTVIAADNGILAGRMAMAIECHGHAYWAPDMETIYDLGGELAYRVKGVSELTDEEAVVLKKFLPSFTYSEDSINEWSTEET